MRTLRRAHPGWFELAVFAPAYATYFGVRALTEGKVSSAMQNAVELLRVERKLDLDWEDAVQGLVIGEHALVDAVNAIYIWGHWPVLIVGGILLFHLGQGEYRRLRTVILLSGGFGLVIFALFPVAPPRLAPVGLLDTVTLHAEAYRKALPPSLINEYAAMPSFHAGWNLLLGIELFRVSRNLLRAGVRGASCRWPWRSRSSPPRTTSCSTSSRAPAVVVTALVLVTWLEKRRETALLDSIAMSAPFVVAHRAGNDLGILRRAEALAPRLVEADLHLRRGRVEVRHLKTLGPLPLLWDRWRLAPGWRPRLELPALLEAAAPGTELMLDLKGHDPPPVAPGGGGARGRRVRRA